MLVLSKDTEDLVTDIKGSEKVWGVGLNVSGILPGGCTVCPLLWLPHVDVKSTHDIGPGGIKYRVSRGISGTRLNLNREKNVWFNLLTNKYLQQYALHTIKVCIRKTHNRI